MAKGLSYRGLNKGDELLIYDFGAHDISPRPVQGGYSGFIKLKSSASLPNNDLSNLDEIVNFYLTTFKLQ